MYLRSAIDAAYSQRMPAADLNLLRTFCAIYASGSLTAAARQLHVTQPSVSHALSRLRHQFDDDLFVRAAGRMAPTAVATELYESLADHLAGIERTVESTAGFDPATSQRRFRLCLTDVGEMNLLPQVLERVMTEAPGIEFEVVPLDVARVADWLAAGRVDAAIASTPIIGAVDSARIMYDRYVCLVRDDFPLEGDTMPLELFTSTRHAVVSASTGHGAAIQHALDDPAMGYKSSVVLHHFSVLPHIIARCGFIGVVPSGTTQQIVDRWPLRTANLPVDLPPFEVRLYWRAQHRASAAQAWLRETLLGVLRKDPADPGQMG